jgi:hypothetical protein
LSNATILKQRIRRKLSEPEIPEISVSPRRWSG